MCRKVYKAVGDEKCLRELSYGTVQNLTQNGGS